MWKNTASNRSVQIVLIIATAFIFVQPAVAATALTSSIFEFDGASATFEAGLQQPEHGVKRSHTGAWDGAPNGGPDFEFVDESGRHAHRSHVESHDDRRRGDDDGHDRDGIIFSAVPEPATYFMLMAGLGLIGVIARHRRNRCE